MNYTILAPAFYSTWDKVRYLKQSAERWNVPITFYGFGEPYKGWHYVQIDRLIEEVEKITTDCIIYTDASDAIINGPIPKPDSEVHWSSEIDYRMCAGGWRAPKDRALRALEIVKETIPTTDSSNPQEKWREALLSSNSLCAMSWPDYAREVFQVADEPLEIRDKRIYNPRTQTFPFIVHFAGGYTDPVVGKAELIEPYWKQLGY